MLFDRFVGGSPLDDHENEILWQHFPRLSQWRSNFRDWVKRKKDELRDIKFSARESPAVWTLKMQKIKIMWDSIPAERRGGGLAELCELLLDKVGLVDNGQIWRIC